MHENFTRDIGDDDSQHVGINLEDTAYEMPITNTVAPNNALLLNEDGTYQFRRFKMTKTEVLTPSDVTEKEANEFGAMLSGLESASNWWRGEWANLYMHGAKDDNERGKIYGMLSEQFGMDSRTLRNCASICRKIKPSRRRDPLTFTHHVEVAALPEKKQIEWLDKAQDENWSASRLHKEIQGKRIRPSGFHRFKTSTLPAIKKQLTGLKGQNRQEAIKMLRLVLEELEDEL